MEEQKEEIKPVHKPHGKHDFQDKTSDVIAAALEVHHVLGMGFQEVIYQRALFEEMKQRGIDFSREENITIHYKGKKIGTRRVDFFVEGCLVEIKAKEAREERDFIQTLSYLRASQGHVALLLNFGTKQLEIQRIVDSRKRKNGNSNQ